jgi:hypothetical protein
MRVQRIEISDDVLAAIRAVVEWYRGCDGPDDIIVNDLPVIDGWLTELGLIPPRDTEDEPA